MSTTRGELLEFLTKLGENSKLANNSKTALITTLIATNNSDLLEWGVTEQRGNQWYASCKLRMKKFDIDDIKVDSTRNSKTEAQVECSKKIILYLDQFLTKPRVVKRHVHEKSELPSFSIKNENVFSFLGESLKPGLRLFIGCDIHCEIDISDAIDIGNVLKNTNWTKSGSNKILKSDGYPKKISYEELVEICKYNAVFISAKKNSVGSLCKIAKWINDVEQC